MLHLDHWQEILDTVRRNKLRTFLTSLSVAWGIFMLVLLLGAGNGLQNKVQEQFADDAVNSLWIWGGRTSLPHEGHPVGKEIHFTDDDYQALAADAPGVEHITGRFYLRGRDVTVAYGDRTSSFDVRATHPDHKYLEKTIIVRGRFLDDLDLVERRKVAVIGIEVAEHLFRGADPIGEWIDIAGIAYRVIGVFEDEGGEGELRKIYLPITTAQMAYGGSDRIHQLMFTVEDAATGDSAGLERQVRQLLAARHDFAPDDPRAVRVRNNLERYQQVESLFDVIRLFVWIVGIGTIVAGIVGVSNIMLISVRERTREIGVRKALGATPASIIGLVLQEAVLLTSVAGYGGLVAGVGVLELARRHLNNDYILNPEVDLGVAVTATVLLVFCGALAGFFPAWRAARLNPVDALKDE